MNLLKIMTESKSPPSNRIPRPSILPPAALGHTYSGNQFQAPLRHKISQALQSTGVSAATSPAVSVSIYTYICNCDIMFCITHNRFYS